MENLDEIDLEDNTTYTSPEPRSDATLFTLFKDVLELEDDTKVANLDKQELGNLDVSVRGAKKVQLIAETLDEPDIAEFFKEEAEIMNATSLAKGGFFAELFVSQKKFSTGFRQISQDLKQQQSIQPQRKGSWPQKNQ